MLLNGDMKMKRFRYICLCSLLCLLLAACASALADPQISFTPENPRVGDYVDVTVTPGRDGAVGVRYELSTADGVVCSNEDAHTHYTASFRPRQETAYTLKATVVYGKKDVETVTVTIPVSGTAPAQDEQDVVYSQKDGWWHKTPYGKKSNETLEYSGCAIFSLSHILHRLGFSGEEVQPAALASANTRFYVAGGTNNGGLIDKAAADYNFVTQDDLVTTAREAVLCLRRGDLFSLGISLGHIAMIDGVSEDGTLVHVVDSAPGATFERKDDKRIRTNGHIYYRQEDGSFVEAESPDQLPGIRWFFETEDYGGMAYWIDLHYCITFNKHAGLRLVRRSWLTMDSSGVTMEYAGTLVSRVRKSEEEAVRVPTSELSWTTDGADGPQIAVITAKKGANFRDGDGNTLARYSKKYGAGTMMPVLSVDDDLCYVFWKDTFCFIRREDVDLIPVQEGSFATGLVSKNGKTKGTAKVTALKAPKAKSGEAAQWTIGTPVAVAEESGDYLLVEGKGCRGWILKDNFTPDAAE